MQVINQKELAFVSGGITDDTINYIQTHVWAQAAVWGAIAGGVLSASITGISCLVMACSGQLKCDQGVPALILMFGAIPGLIGGGIVGAAIGGIIEATE